MHACVHGSSPLQDCECLRVLLVCVRDLPAGRAHGHPRRVPGVEDQGVRGGGAGVRGGVQVPRGQEAARGLPHRCVPFPLSPSNCPCIH
jgi:hypothetical protein